MRIRSSSRATPAHAGIAVVQLGRVLWLAIASVFAISAAYLVGLLMAARSSLRSSGMRGSIPEDLDIAVLVPAHNEEPGIAETLTSLEGCEYPAKGWRTIVIADNCTDQTADGAHAAGVEVWERANPLQQGKGFALAWALERLLSGDHAPDVVVMVDADCTVSPNLLNAVASGIAAGAEAIQVDYVAGNPGDSLTSALRFAGFSLADTVRFLGKERLGLSCGLVGTGMAFTRELLEEVPWTTTGLVEDGEFHMQLVLAGKRARFLPQAWVSQAVPTSMRVSTEQQARWEKGRLELAKQWGPRLLVDGLRRRDVVPLHAGLECLVPPQSVIATGAAASATAGLVMRSRPLLAVSAFTILAQAIFVFGGLRLVQAPTNVYRALVAAPILVAAKLSLYARLALGRGPSGWVRTEREAPPHKSHPVEKTAE
ncbi:MAG: glycosyltransferase family 2 protein [Solirubrobacterales bacterium]